MRFNSHLCIIESRVEREKIKFSFTRERLDIAQENTVALSVCMAHVSTPKLNVKKVISSFHRDFVQAQYRILCQSEKSSSLTLDADRNSSNYTEIICA